MKLPIILSAMIAALAIPGSLASEATNETKTEAQAPEAMPEGEKASEATKTASKPAHKMKKHKRHHRSGSGQRHPSDAYDLAFDDPNFPRGNDGEGCSVQASDNGKMMPPEVPGQRGPEVPAGQ